MHVEARHPHRAVRRGELRADEPEERRLAGAARAEDGHDLAARDAQRQAPEDLEIAVGKIQVVDLDCVVHGAEF